MTAEFWLALLAVVVTVGLAIAAWARSEARDARLKADALAAKTAAHEKGIERLEALTDSTVGKIADAVAEALKGKRVG